MIFFGMPFKELLDRNAKNDYYLKPMDGAYKFTQQWVNPVSRIDSQLLD